MLIRINLLPTERSIYSYLIYVTLAIFLSSFLVTIYLTTQNQWLENEIQLLTSDLFIQDNFLSSIDWQREVQILQKDIGESLQKANMIDKNETLKLLTPIAYSLPDYIWLTRIQTLDGERLFIQGECLNYDLVLVWIEKLKKEPAVKHVQLQELAGNPHVQFKIEIEARGGLL